MRLIDADALAAKMFSHTYCVPVLENEQKVLGEALHMVHEAPTVVVCEQCDFRNLSESIINIIVDKMIELGIDDLDDLMKLIKEQEAST